MKHDLLITLGTQSTCQIVFPPLITRISCNEVSKFILGGFAYKPGVQWPRVPRQLYSEVLAQISELIIGTDIVNKSGWIQTKYGNRFSS